MSRQRLARARHGGHAVVELERGEARVQSASGDERVVRALVDDAALVDDEDAVGVADRREAMRDHEGRAALHEPREGVLHGGLALGVESARGLVEEQDRRVLEQGSRDGDPLALPAGQLDAPLADLGGVAALGGEDELVGVRRARRLLYLFVTRIQTPVADVLGERHAEELDVLRDERDGLADALDGHLAHVYAVDADGPAVGVVEAGNQVQQRRLARAARADEGDGLAGGNAQRDAVQHVPPVLVGERHVVELDLAAHGRRQRLGPLAPTGSRGPCRAARTGARWRQRRCRTRRRGGSRHSPSARC